MTTLKRKITAPIGHFEIFRYRHKQSETSPRSIIFVVKGKPVLNQLTDFPIRLNVANEAKPFYRHFCRCYFVSFDLTVLIDKIQLCRPTKMSRDDLSSTDTGCD